MALSAINPVVCSRHISTVTSPLPFAANSGQCFDTLSESRIFPSSSSTITEAAVATGFVTDAMSNSVSAVSDVDDAPGLIDAAAEAGANQVSGPGLSSSNAEALYRQALAKAVADARLRAEVLAKAAGRSLGEITTIVEGGAQPTPLYREAALDAAQSTPIVPGQQETSASISVTFSLR